MGKVNGGFLTISEIKALIKREKAIAEYNQQANIRWCKESLELATASGDAKRIAKARSKLLFCETYMDDWRKTVRIEIECSKYAPVEPKIERPNIENHNGFCGFMDDLEIANDPATSELMQAEYEEKLKKYNERVARKKGLTKTVCK